MPLKAFLKDCLAAILAAIGIYYLLLVGAVGAYIALDHTTLSIPLADLFWRRPLMLVADASFGGPRTLVNRALFILGLPYVFLPLLTVSILSARNCFRKHPEKRVWTLAFSVWYLLIACLCVAFSCFPLRLSNGWGNVLAKFFHAIVSLPFYIATFPFRNRDPQPLLIWLEIFVTTPFLWVPLLVYGMRWRRAKLGKEKCVL